MLASNEIYSYRDRRKGRHFVQWSVFHPFPGERYLWLTAVTGASCKRNNRQKPLQCSNKASGLVHHPKATL